MIKLLFPIIFPSWRFFSSIGPSPRFDFGFIRFTDEQPETWQEFSVLPDKITQIEGVIRLFHNPEWNERLYINSCAEHLFDKYSEFCEQEIARRILWILNRQNKVPENYPYFCYRIHVVTHEDSGVNEELVFSAKPFLVKRGMQS